MNEFNECNAYYFITGGMNLFLAVYESAKALAMSMWKNYMCIFNMLYNVVPHGSSMTSDEASRPMRVSW